MTTAQGANVAAVYGSTVVAGNMGAAGSTQQRGTISAAAGSVISTDLTNTVDGEYTGRLFAVTSGGAFQQFAYIANYDGTTKDVTLVTPLPTTPSNGDTFVII